MSVRHLKTEEFKTEIFDNVRISCMGDVKGNNWHHCKSYLYVD